MSPDDLDTIPCRTADPEWWFADGATVTTRYLRDTAVRKCRLDCPAEVRAACLRVALDTEKPGERHGVWGGTTPDERTKLARRQRKNAVA